jgi:hypothetical protein
MWEEFRERLGEAWTEPWRPLGLPALGSLLGLFLLVALVEALRAERWVPLLDDANLIFHEAGHPVFGLLGWETLAILGGTLMQLLVPLLVAGSFWWKRQAAGFAFGLFWHFQNYLNIARYMADARDGLLPLVGGGEHDWTELFGRWNCLSRDKPIAGDAAFLGWAGMLGAALWLGFRWWKGRIRP